MKVVFNIMFGSKKILKKGKKYKEIFFIMFCFTIKNMKYIYF